MTLKRGNAILNEGSNPFSDTVVEDLNIMILYIIVYLSLYSYRLFHDPTKMLENNNKLYLHQDMPTASSTLCKD